MKVMVLAGGPDREREVSLQSGDTIARGLLGAGHDVLSRDVLPDDLSALDEFARWGGEVVFPALHGAWGEGGPLQRILEERGLRFVGCGSQAAALCMDKAATKARLLERGLPTPASEVLRRGETPTLRPPVVVKPVDEGSSIDVAVCRDEATLAAKLEDFFTRNKRLLVEQYIRGQELALGVIGFDPAETSENISPSAPFALPPIQIVPATEFYDYEAKYLRDDTQYLFDFGATRETLAMLTRLASDAFVALECRHLSRIDVFLDEQGQAWIIEVNTLPGFTSHSLLPKAAARAGVPLATLVDRLARLA